jgi:hypothetical protein
VKRILVVLVVACGGSKPQVVENRSPAPDPKPAGGITVVDRTNNGGVLQLSGNRGAANRRADEEMAKHCGPAQYRVVQEGEELISETPMQTAWRVHYVCTSE